LEIKIVMDCFVVAAAAASADNSLKVEYINEGI